jgi:hypothetical protein
MGAASEVAVYQNSRSLVFAAAGRRFDQRTEPAMSFDQAGGFGGKQAVLRYSRERASSRA